MRIAICDDDPRERQLIEQYVFDRMKKHPEIEFQVLSFGSGEELIAAYHANSDFDILFLDIQMNGMDGIQTAQTVRKTNKSAIIFFITGFTQYISDAFPLNAFQFILKPVNKNTFDREFERALKKYYIEHTKYIIENHSCTIALEIRDIVYLESADHYIIVHTENGEYMKRGNLNDEEKALIPYGFVRTHRKHLANMAYFLEITQTDIELKNGSRLYLSERKLAEVKLCFNSFLAGGLLCSN